MIPTKRTNNYGVPSMGQSTLLGAGDSTGDEAGVASAHPATYGLNAWHSWAQ